MKTFLLPSLKLTAILIVLCAVIYPIVVMLIGQLAPGHGNGVTVRMNGKVAGYENIGQLFTRDDHFQGRPSVVDHNAAGSGGSNKGASNADYLATVKARIDTFLIHNPGIQKKDIPSELVTASGSGLDPDISVRSAQIQVPRIARLRRLKEQDLLALIDQLKDKPLLGPEKINVLKLNIALDSK